MSQKGKLLIVEDNPQILEALEFFLEEEFELVILDLMLPNMDGFEICKKIREVKNIPVIMVSAKKDDIDKIRGLGLGADDYMTKPFSPQELISRIQAIFRRLQTLPGTLEETTFSISGLNVLVEQREVYVDDKPIELTPKEFELLLFLCKHKGKVLSRQQLLHGVWDYHFLGDTRIVDVHISHLRDKIEKNARSPQYIMTVRNVGYKLNSPNLAESSYA